MIETPARASWRRRGSAQPLYRGGGRRRRDRLPLPAQRQSGPGHKFDYKLRWFDRLIAHAAELLASGAPIVLAGDFNVMPTELDVYKPERWVDDALFRIEVRDAFGRLVAQGWTDALRTLHPAERIYTFWDYFRNAYARDAGLRIDHLLLKPVRRPASSGGRGRSGGARLGKSERPRAGLDRAHRRGAAAEAETAGFPRARPNEWRWCRPLGEPPACGARPLRLSACGRICEIVGRRKAPR